MRMCCIKRVLDRSDLLVSLSVLVGLRKSKMQWTINSPLHSPTCKASVMCRLPRIWSRPLSTAFLYSPPLLI